MGCNKSKYVGSSHQSLTIMKKIKVGIFFGGISPEHDVSIVSASGVVGNIEKSKFIVKEIYIDKQGGFWSGKRVLEKVKQGKVKDLEKLDFNSLAKKIDIAFPVLHGQGGEDGSIQGFFRILNIPFVGADILASCVCLDKSIFNQLMLGNGLPKPKFINFDFKQDSEQELKNKLKQVKILKFPLFVKPSRTGSSVGICKVKKYNEIEKILNKTKQFDNRVVVEEGVDVLKEIEVSVFGNAVKDFKVSIPGALKPGAEFYDYNDKYFDDKTIFEIPAKLKKGKVKEIQGLALKAYKISNCESLARVDFLMDKNEEVYLNEINTLPGFTPSSMYPKLWAMNGLSFDKLISNLIELAINNNRGFSD